MVASITLLCSFAIASFSPFKEPQNSVVEASLRKQTTIETLNLVSGRCFSKDIRRTQSASEKNRENPSNRGASRLSRVSSSKHVKAIDKKSETGAREDSIAGTPRQKSVRLNNSKPGSLSASRDPSVRGKGGASPVDHKCFIHVGVLLEKEKHSSPTASPSDALQRVGQPTCSPTSKISQEGARKPERDGFPCPALRDLSARSGKNYKANIIAEQSSEDQQSDVLPMRSSKGAEGPIAPVSSPDPFVLPFHITQPTQPLEPSPPFDSGIDDDLLPDVSSRQDGGVAGRRGKTPGSLSILFEGARETQPSAPGPALERHSASAVRLPLDHDESSPASHVSLALDSMSPDDLAAMGSIAPRSAEGAILLDAMAPCRDVAAAEMLDSLGVSPYEFEYEGGGCCCTCVSVCAIPEGEEGLEQEAVEIDSKEDVGEFADSDADADADGSEGCGEGTDCGDEEDPEATDEAREEDPVLKAIENRDQRFVSNMAKYSVNSRPVAHVYLQYLKHDPLIKRSITRCLGHVDCPSLYPPWWSHPPHCAGCEASDAQSPQAFATSSGSSTFPLAAPLVPLPHGGATEARAPQPQGKGPSVVASRSEPASSAPAAVSSAKTTTGSAAETGASASAPVARALPTSPTGQAPPGEGLDVAQTPPQSPAPSALHRMVAARSDPVGVQSRNHSRCSSVSEGGGAVSTPRSSMCGTDTQGSLTAGLSTASVSTSSSVPIPVACGPSPAALGQRNVGSSRSSPVLIYLQEELLLGQGAYGMVTQVRDMTRGRRYALKRLPKFKVASSLESVLEEQRVLRRLECTFCIRQLASFQDPYYLYILMELCSAGDLADVLSAEIRPAPLPPLWMRLASSVPTTKRLPHYRRVALSEDVARFYAAGVLLALAHLHERFIVYRDLKPSNVLLDAKGYPKLADFGMACWLGPSGTSSACCGTPHYIAPEVVSAEYGGGQSQRMPYGLSPDWWCFGGVLYTLLSGSRPFSLEREEGPEEEPWDIIRRVIDPRYEVPYPPYLSSEASNLLQSLLVRQPKWRLGCRGEGAKEIMQHPWFKGFDWEAMASRRMKPPRQPKAQDYERRRRWLAAKYFAPEDRSEAYNAAAAAAAAAKAKAATIKPGAPLPYTGEQMSQLLGCF